MSVGFVFEVVLALLNLMMGVAQLGYWKVNLFVAGWCTAFAVMKL